VSNFVVVKAHKHLLGFVDAMQRKNSDSISFYPRVAFEKASERGRILLGLLDGEPCGYLYFGALGGDVRCYQVCVDFSLRRRMYGAALVVAMEEEAERCHSRSLTLRCGFDLDANDFWRDLQYQCVGHRQGGVRRMRTINVWRKQLQRRLFDMGEVEPARGTTDARMWAKHKRTGLVTQFVRGVRLAEYRALVLGADE
jgi:GNAT superfamily N-acetyltransferase